MSANPDGSRGRGKSSIAPDADAGLCAQPGVAAGDPRPPGWGAGGGRYRRAVLETAILASLAESTTHGYDLVEQIDTLAAGLVCIDPGSMYRLLRELEEQGLVSSSWQTPESGPSRRVYVITDRGVEALGLMAESLAARAEAMRHLADHAARAVERKTASRGGN